MASLSPRTQLPYSGPHLELSATHTLFLISARGQGKGQRQPASCSSPGTAPHVPCSPGHLSSGITPVRGGELRIATCVTHL